MMSDAIVADRSRRAAYIVTGATSGIGRATALELARYGTVVLAGRNPGKLGQVQSIIEKSGRRAVAVACDLADMASVRRAARAIAELRLPIAGLINNAGIRQARPTTSAQGWDMSFATNHVGPFALTEALVPQLADGTNVVFVVSAVEDPERKAAVAAGFRGGRYISAQASAQGKWQPGGAKRPGFDAYATSKQAILAAALAFCTANASPALQRRRTGSQPDHRPRRRQRPHAPRDPDARSVVQAIRRDLSTPKQAARVIAAMATDASGNTGVYHDERGRPMRSSARGCHRRAGWRRTATSSLHAGCIDSSARVSVTTRSWNAGFRGRRSRGLRTNTCPVIPEAPRPDTISCRGPIAVGQQ